MKAVVIGGKTRAYIRLVFVLFLLVMLLVSLTQCESKKNGNDDYSVLKKEEDEQERYELRQELLMLRNNIDRKLETVYDRLENISAEARDELLKADRKLKGNKAKIEKTIEDLDKANDDTWTSVRQAVKKTTHDVRSAFEELAYDIDNME